MAGASNILVFVLNVVLMKAASIPSFNDPKFAEQYFLSERYGVTMNIMKAWRKGFTGKGVTICVHDPTGVEKDNDEFAGKFLMQGSFDFTRNTSDPAPDSGGLKDGILAHGTKMAGLAAAKANNGKCGVGVAYDASLSGIKFSLSLVNRLDDNRFPFTLKYERDVNHIYSCSWGPMGMWENEMGYIYEPEKNAMKSSTEKGRSGRGNIYVFAAGNGGVFNATCGYDEVVTSIYTIGISVVTGHNNRSHQDVKCSAINAVAYSRDGMMGINYKHDHMPAPALQNSCSNNAAASSAAAAVASGVFALVLQANPNLGWRDVQHLIARSSCSQFTSVPWRTNKAGIRFSDDFGFGLLDADALTTNAVNWTNVGQQQECVISYNTPEPINRVDTIKKSLNFIAWPASCGGEAKRINFLEHVVLQLSFNFTFRRNIEVEVASPGGTKSFILRSGRRLDGGQEVKNLSTMSLHFWGENPRGNWEFTLRNVKPDTNQNGTLYNWSFKLYGTTADPLAGNTIVESQIMAGKPRSTAASPTTNTNIAKNHTSSGTSVRWTNGYITQPTSSSFNFTEPCGKKNSKPCGSVAIGASSLMAILSTSIVILIGHFG